MKKSCEANKVGDTKGETAERGKISETGTVSSSRTQREKTPKLQIVKPSDEKRGIRELSGSKKGVMLSFGACSHVILLCILEDKSPPLLLR